MMMNSSENFLRSSASSTPAVLTQAVLVGALSIGAVLGGLVPHLNPHSLLPSFSSVASAQTNNQIEKYAKVAYRIELLRQQLYEEAREKMGGNTPDNLCQQPNLPESVAAICQRFRQRSAEIVASERDGEFNESVFNDITRRKASDPGLQKRIDEAVSRIQGR